LIDGGYFDWAASDCFPQMTEPYEGYHGIIFTEEFGPSAFIMRARAEGLRDFGACMSPANAFYIIQGVETLPVRIERHVSNAEKVVSFLDGHEMVSWIKYPNLPQHPDRGLVDKYLPNGAGSMVSFGLKGGRGAGVKFIESLEVFSHLANVGDAKSLILHPASTTHQQMNAEQLAAAGIGEDMVRMSVGLEDPEDLTKDLSRALRAAARV